MQQRSVLCFETRDISSKRRLRRLGALALLLSAFGMSAGGCSRQAEGERCDHAANGDDDCDEGLECVTPRGSTVDRCCPPAGAPIDDVRCNGSDAPLATGGTAGASSETGGTSSGGAGAAGTTGGAFMSGGTAGNATNGGSAGDATNGGGAGEASAGDGGQPADGSGGAPAGSAGDSSSAGQTDSGGSDG